MMQIVEVLLFVTRLAVRWSAGESGNSCEYTWAVRRRMRTDLKKEGIYSTVRAVSELFLEMPELMPAVR
jgi:hypothetical protein